ncbi:hypothetical protein [Streptomyces sp. NPDC051684]|uniref:hypothetical protein n=1 Tax=Streptomyces sp. NPDC051684 TaxID=3365670 RepID=UPI0037B28B75
MKRVIAAAGAALVIFGGVEACGSSVGNDTSGDTVSTETKKEAPPEPEEDNPAEPKKEAPAEPESQSAMEGAPTLKAGATVHVKTTEYSDDDLGSSSGTADVTLVSVKEYSAADLPEDSFANDLSQGEELVVVTLKVENTGSGEISMLPYSSNITWTGKDGQVASVMTGYLDETYVPEDLTSTDSLQPGEHVQGGTVVVIHATQPGKLHFADDSEKHLFDVDTQGVA